MSDERPGTPVSPATSPVAVAPAAVPGSATPDAAVTAGPTLPSTPEIQAALFAAVATQLDEREERSRIRVLRARMLIVLQGWLALVLLWDQQIIAAPADWDWAFAWPVLGMPSFWVTVAVLVLFVASRYGEYPVHAVHLGAGLVLTLGVALVLLSVVSSLAWVFVLFLAVVIWVVVDCEWRRIGLHPRVAALWPALNFVVLAGLWADGVFFRFTMGHLNFVHVWYLSMEPWRIVEDIAITSRQLVKLVVPAGGAVVLLLLVAFSARFVGVRRPRATPWPLPLLLAFFAVTLWAVMPRLAYPHQIPRYLGLRLQSLVPVPDIAPFKTPAMRAAGQSSAALDLERCWQQGEFATASPTQPRRHLVMLWCESLRADMFAAEMPAMCALASHHLYLRQHCATNNNTINAMAALHYGFLPVQLLQFFDRHESPAWHRWLRQCGYRLVHFEAIDAWGAMPTHQEFTMRYRPRDAGGYRSTELVLDDIIEELQKGGPCVLDGYLFNTHWNYYYPPEFTRYQPTLDVDADLFGADPTPDLALRVGNRFRNASRYLDHLLARFFARLHSAGLASNTVVVILGDHGESLGEAGYLGHCTGPMPEQFRVPCVIVTPDAVCQAIDVPTTHLDVVPTLAPFLGFTVHGLPGADARTASRTAWVLVDNANSWSLGKILVRQGNTMSIFAAGNGWLQWFLTTTADYAVDARPNGLYAMVNNDRLAALVARDLRTAWQALRQP